ncbi:MAG: hypothetical protein WDM77_22025 [Steroidobacteraceae bacterium]
MPALLSPGGAGLQVTTLIAGNLVQSGTGSLLIDVNPQRHDPPIT